MRFFLPFILASVSAADTIVAVVEVGKRGVVRRTTSSSAQASASAVSSFWNTLHDVEVGAGNRRMKATQHPAMTVVPDMFQKPKGGIVIGLKGSGVDLAVMETVSRQLTSGVGHFEVAGSQDQLMTKASKSTETVTDSATYSSSLENKVRSLKEGSNKLTSVSLKVDNDESARKADSAIAGAIESARKLAEDMDGTIIVHLIVEEEDGAMRRRLTTRDLNEDEDEEADEEEQAQYQEKNNFYGWGYYNDYGEWVSNYKTIFQIQYFQVVLWTAIGLVIILSMSIGHMINMPLMSDTLLFGESAKMMGG